MGSTDTLDNNKDCNTRNNRDNNSMGRNNSDRNNRDDAEEDIDSPLTDLYGLEYRLIDCPPKG
jgi:hypothetical protein